MKAAKAAHALNLVEHVLSHGISTSIRYRNFSRPVLFFLLSYSRSAKLLSILSIPAGLLGFTTFMLAKKLSPKEEESKNSTLKILKQHRRMT